MLNIDVTVGKKKRPNKRETIVKTGGVNHC